MDCNKEDVRKFWDDRAKLGATAGTNDFILNELEVREILGRVPAGSRVLDIGCGTGRTLYRLAQEADCTCIGIDWSSENTAKAKEFLAETSSASSIEIRQGELPGLGIAPNSFPVVITQRCLINLTEYSDQKAAFEEIRTIVAPGGLYLMVENSVEGLEQTNELRSGLGIETMAPAWHNLYLKEKEVEAWQRPDFRLETLVHLSSTYFLLSRGVYARLAADAGEELRYDSEINKLALRIKPVGTYGPTKLWVWRKGVSH